MSIYRRKREFQNDESFGPGTDLVITLVAILISFFFIQSLTINVINMAWKIDNLKKNIANEELDEMKKKAGELENVEQKKKEIEKILEQMKEEEEEIKRKIAEKKEEEEEIEKKLKEKKEEKDIEDGVVFRLSAVMDGEKMFDYNSDQLTDLAKERLEQQIPLLVEILTGKSKYNQLVVIGRASPDTRPNATLEGSSNLTLSIGRALSVANYLQDMGIPMDCMVIYGLGRASSKVLMKSLKNKVDSKNTAIKGNKEMQSWFNIWNEQGKFEDVDEESLAVERSVEIKKTHDELSHCFMPE